MSDYITYSVVQFANIELEVSVVWSGLEDFIRFPVYVNSTILDVLEEKLNVDSTKLKIFMVNLPQVMFARRFFGKMEEEEWLHLDGETLMASGSFKFYISGMELKLGQQYTLISVECAQVSVVTDKL